MKGGPGADHCWLSPKGHATLGLRVLQFVHGLELPIGDAFVGEQPEPLAGLELWRIGRQEKELEACGDDHLSTGMLASLIKNEQNAPVCTALGLASGTMLRSGLITPGDAPPLAALLDHPPVLTRDGEGLWPLRDWAQAVMGQLVLFGRMERLAGHLTHARQGERVVVWRMWPSQHGSPADDLSWYRAASGVEAGPTRLETMRRLVLHLAAQEPLML